MALLVAKAETPTLFIAPQQRETDEAWCLQQPALAVLPYIFKTRTILWLHLCLGTSIGQGLSASDIQKACHASHEGCKSLTQDALN